MEVEKEKEKIGVHMEKNGKLKLFRCKVEA